VFLILIGVAAGVLTAGNMMVIPLCLIFGAVILYLAGAHQVPAPDRKFLFKLALGALLVRLLFIVATHSFDTALISYVNTSDALYYEYMGRLISDTWHEGESIVINKANYGYLYWNGLFYFLAGFKPDLLRVLNSIAAIGTGLCLYFHFTEAKRSEGGQDKLCSCCFFPFGNSLVKFKFERQFNNFFNYPNR